MFARLFISILPRPRISFPVITAFCITFLLGSFTGCGGSNPSTTPPPSTIKDRVLVSDQLISSGFPSGTVVVVDAQKDVISASSVNTAGAPGGMLLSPDKTHTLVMDASTHSVYAIDNATETLAGTIALADAPTSMVVLSDNATGYVALRNAGQVSIFDYSTKFAVTNNVAVPSVRTLVLSHKGNALLAFSDDVDTLTYIDTSSNTPTTIAGFDRPVNAVFSSDDSKAFILSCGFECGGMAAKVTVLDIASKTPGASVAVPGATIGLLDPSGATLYVAGACPQMGCTPHGGVLSLVNVSNASSLTTGNAPVDISNGFHQVISLGSNNKLFIGSRTCDNVTFGCLSIYDISAAKATIDGPNGDVTALQPITGRTVMYVIEGGELRIIDTTTNALTPTQVDIIGKAVGVLAIDQ